MILSKYQAIKVAQDLERGDRADSTVKIQKNEIRLLEKRSLEQDSLISIKADQIVNFQRIQVRQVEIIEATEEQRDIHKKQARKFKRQRNLIGLGSIIAVLVALIL